jgi:hypothetical protein
MAFAKTSIWRAAAPHPAFLCNRSRVPQADN